MNTIKKLLANPYSKVIAVAAIVLVILGSGTLAVRAYNGQLFGDCNNCTINLAEATSESLGAISDARPARLWTIGYLNVLNDAEIDGALQVDGALTASGAISGLDSLSTVSTYVASTTLTNADSGKTFILTTTTEFVLPATSTSAGVHYKFVVGGGITANATIRTSDLGNNIEGTLIVAGAVVDCDAEDTITFVADGENIGDYVELWSNGTYWFIGDSGALTGSKLTCSTST